jgi:hypothetical protein
VSFNFGLESNKEGTAGSSRSFTAIRKDAGLYCGSRLRSGEVFAYVDSIQNLKDRKKTDPNEARRARMRRGGSCVGSCSGHVPAVNLRASRQLTGQSSAPVLSHRAYLFLCFRESTPPQNRQLIICFYSLKYQVDGFVGELTLQNL